jgi:steroid delta-isomerase-like uncharacterized protein
MSQEHANKARAWEVLDAAFNRGELDALETQFTYDARIHDPGVEFHGPAELRRALVGLRTTFPDFHVSVEDMFGEGDRVAIRYRGRGTHSAEFLGVPATGRRIDYTGILIVRLFAGKIAEFWAQPDQLGVLTQLGAYVRHSHTLGDAT